MKQIKVNARIVGEVNSKLAQDSPNDDLIVVSNPLDEMTALAADVSLFFFFNDTANTEIYTLSLHDALPIYDGGVGRQRAVACRGGEEVAGGPTGRRSEEHTSELQSRGQLVCRLLLEKK